MFSLGTGELEKGTTYKVTFKVKPSQAAYDEAAKNGMETEFPSNDDAGTKVFYKTVLKAKLFILCSAPEPV